MPLFDSRLTPMGWDDWFEQRFMAFAAQGLVPARVTADYGAEYLVHDAFESMRAVGGKHLRDDAAKQPAVGDWVGLLHRESMSVVHGIVERRTAFSRKVAGLETKEQVLAANVDLAFVVVSAQDVNVRRVERYVAMAWHSGAVPVVLLTKADIATTPAELREELEAAVVGVQVLITSSVTGAGVEDIAAQLQPARTGVLLGPSGAGKSSLINRLTGAELMKTRTVHRTGEGRHMTSHRNMFELEAGGLIIDTPGLREAQLWQGDGDSLGNLFEDVEKLALECRFQDCEHRSEPGCAIKAAIAGGSLDEVRLTSYRKLQRELRAVAAKSDARLRIDERRKWKQITVANRERDRFLRK